MKKTRKIRKYQDGGTVPTTDPNVQGMVESETTSGGDPNKPKTSGTPTASSRIPLPNYDDASSRLNYAKAFRQKYGPLMAGRGDTPLNIDYIPDTDEQSFKQMSSAAANRLGLDPAIFYASAMEEGMSGLIPNKKGEVSFSGDDAFPISGYVNFGLDTFSDAFPGLVKKGYLSQDFQSQFKKSVEPPLEGDNKTSVNSANFVNVNSALQAKAAMVRNSRDQLEDYLKKNNITLSQRGKEFFALMAYNAGLGNAQKMLQDYSRAGALKDDAYLQNRPTSGAGLKATSWSVPYENTIRRMQMADALRAEGYYDSMKFGGKMKKVPKYQFGTDGGIDPIKDKQGIDVWQNANSSPVPARPGQQPAMTVTQQQGTPVASPNIIPLTEFNTQRRDLFGNIINTPTGQYVNDQGEVNTFDDQQAMNNQISEQNRRNAEQNARDLSDFEMSAGIGITALNNFLGNRNAANQRNSSLRRAIMQQMNASQINPYLEGTGSQAIMEYGGSMDEYKQGGGIHIKKENRGKFTAAAKRAGKSVQAYAAQIMANKERYSPTLVKRANFARNAAKWHEFGGPINDDNSIPGYDQGVNVLDGGSAKLISGSYNSNPMLEFTGRDHDDGGIGVEFGGSVAEVENKEVGWVDDSGSLNIFGKLKLPGTNMTFRKAAKDIAEQEDKIDGKLGKYINILNNGDPADPYQKSAQSTAKVMFKSLDKRSKELAEKKQALTDYQNLILSIADQQAKIMKYGGSMYQNGGEIEDPILSKTGFSNPAFNRTLRQSLGIDATVRETPTGTVSMRQRPPQSIVNTEGINLHDLFRNPEQKVISSRNTLFNTGDFTGMTSATQLSKEEFNRRRAYEQLLANNPEPELIDPYAPVTRTTEFNTGDFIGTGTITGRRKKPKTEEDVFTRTTEFNTGDFIGTGTITGRRKMQEGGPIDPELERVFKAIGQFESGNDYSARGKTVTKGQYKGQRALGKYQIMPGNLATWSKEALGREVSQEEFLKNPALQDQIALHQMSNIYKRYKNPQDVASVWFTGSPVNKSSAQKKDVLGTSGSDYVSSVMEIYNTMNPGAALTTGNPGQVTQRSSVVDPAPLTGSVSSFNAFNYTPVFGANNATDPNSGVVATPYGAATRDPAPFSEKTNIVDGSRKRGYISPLAFEQIAPELLTLATNQQEGVPQLTYQPNLQQTFDISYQLGRNQNQSTFNQAAKIAEQTGNIDALAQLAAQKYQADQQYNMQEIQGNAQQRLATYNQNTNTLNDAQLKNLAFLADQQQKQAQARFNTRAEAIAATASMSSKVLQNQLENRTYNAYANLFKNYGFDKNGNVTFDPGKVTQKFTAGEAAQFGMMSAQQGAQAILNGDFSRQFTKVKNPDGSQTTTETLGTNKKIQEEYKALKNQGFDDSLIGNMLRAKYPETITN